jgi:hypothetical protein
MIQENPLAAMVDVGLMVVIEVRREHYRELAHKAAQRPGIWQRDY